MNKLCKILHSQIFTISWIKCKNCKNNRRCLIQITEMFWISPAGLRVSPAGLRWKVVLIICSVLYTENRNGIKLLLLIHFMHFTVHPPHPLSQLKNFVFGVNNSVLELFEQNLLMCVIKIVLGLNSTFIVISLISTKVTK